nr:hypothetical protein OG781_42630 [Streptomyces sp. NBC_00830]
MIAAGLREHAKSRQATAAVELLIRHDAWTHALAEPHDPRLENSIARFALKGLLNEGKPIVNVD